jgi:hypothetical protein
MKKTSLVFLLGLTASGAGLALGFARPATRLGAKNLVAACREASVAARSTPPFGGTPQMNLPFSSADLAAWKSFAEVNTAALGASRRTP